MNSVVVSATPAPLVQQLAAVRRHARLMILTILGGVVASVLLALLLPATYRSSATILIEQQEIPQELVRSTITTYADQRVQVISQRVMTTTNLLKIIRSYNLYPRAQKTEPREALIGRMRDDIEMDIISADVIDPRTGYPTRATIAFSVAYENRSPDLAVKVANELTSLYLNENLTSRSQRVQETSVFLAQEAERLSGEIAALEQRLADFKERHVDGLPEYTQLNFQLMDRTELELREVESRIRSFEEQEVFLSAQLAQIDPTSQVFLDTGERILSTTDRLKALRTRLASLSALYAADHPDVVRVKREVEGLERNADAGSAQGDMQRQLTDARGSLATLRETYSADHPDVRTLERQIEGLELSLAAEPPPRTARTTAEPDNPAYIQIRAQLENALSGRRTLEVKRAELKARLAAFERKLAQSPEIEREYRTLTRDHENAQVKYQEVRAKQMEAQLAQNLEADNKGERFTLIEPPLPPEKPVSPNRIAILVLGALLAIAAGVGAVALRETLSGAVRGRSDIAALLSVPPLAVIPCIETTIERVRRRLRVRYAVFGTLAALVVASLLVHVLYRPLDVVWFTALRRLGI